MYKQYKILVTLVTMKVLINSMSILIKFMKSFTIKEKPKQLGRWNINYCNKVTNKKIDLSNEDHCGPCGQYIMEKNKKII